MSWVWSVLSGTINRARGDATVKLDGIIPNHRVARIDTISLRGVGEMKPVVYMLDVKLESGEHIHTSDRWYSLLKEKFPHPDDGDKIFEAEFKWSHAFAR